MRHLIDTSAWIEALRRDGDTETRRMVIELAREGEAVVCEMILLELWNGARGKKEVDVVRSLEAELDLVPILPTSGGQPLRSRRIAGRVGSPSRRRISSSLPPPTITSSDSSTAMRTSTRSRKFAPAAQGHQTSGRKYDISPDGQQFLFLKPAGAQTSEDAGPPRLIVVEKWIEEQKLRVATN